MYIIEILLGHFHILILTVTATTNRWLLLTRTESLNLMIINGFTAFCLERDFIHEKVPLDPHSSSTETKDCYNQSSPCPIEETKASRGGR